MLGSFGALIKALLIIVPAALAYTALVREEDGRWLRGRPLAIMLILFVAGMTMPSVWIMFVLMVALLPLLARDRSEAIAMFPLVVLSTPAFTLYPEIGGAYILPIDKYLCAGVGLGIAMLALPAPRVRMGRYYDLPFVLLLILQLVLARGLNFTSTVRGLLDPLLGIALPYYTVSRCLRTPEDHRRLLLVTGLCAAVLGTVAMFEARSGWLIYQTMYNRLGVDITTTLYTKMRGGMLRAVTTFSDATAFAMFLATAAVALFAIRTSFRSTAHWLIALGMVSLGMLAANSRNCFVGLGIALLMFDLYRRAYASLTAKLVVGGLAAGVMVLLAQISRFAQSLTGQSGDALATNDYRHQLLVRGLEEFSKHPWAGLDVASVYAHLEDMRQGEGIIDFVNAYLYYALTTGIAGPILLLLGFALPVVAMWRRRARFNQGGRELDRIGGYVAGVAASFVITSALTAFGTRDSLALYMTLAMGAALWAQPRSLAAAAPAATPPPDPAAVPAAPAARPGDFGRFALPATARIERGLA